MEIDKSNDNIAFNGINLNESNNDSDDEDDDNDMSIDHNTLRNEMIINEPRPNRIRKVTARYRLSPPVIVIPNKAKKSNKSRDIPVVQARIRPVAANDNEVAVQRRVRRMLAIQNHVRRINTNHQININAVEEVIDIAQANDNEVAIQRRVRRMLDIQNHVRGINTNHQININAIEEVIDVAPVVIPRVPIDNEIPYQANPLRRNNALMAIQALLENVRIDIEANARNAGLNIFQARDKLKSDLLLAGTGVVPDTLLIDQTAMRNSMNAFIIKINTTKLESCKYCKERWFNDGGKTIDNDTYVCKECLPGYKQCNKNGRQYIAKMSQENNMDPYYHPDPLAMAEYEYLITHHKLTKIESALIAKQKVIMKVYKLVGPHGGSNLGF